MTSRTDRPRRPRRCQLSVPGSSEKMLAKGAGLAVDHVFLDLEDAVAPNMKPAARGMIVEALNSLEWRPRTVCLRINDLAGLDEVFNNLSQVPPAQVDAGLQYAKGKAYYFKKSYSDASSSLQAVPAGSAYAHQARYFEGLVAMKTATPSTP